MHPSAITPWMVVCPTRWHTFQMLGFRLWATLSHHKGCFLNPKPCSMLPKSFGSYKGHDPLVNHFLFFLFCAYQTSFYSTSLSTYAMLRSFCSCYFLLPASDFSIDVLNVLVFNFIYSLWGPWTPSWYSHCSMYRFGEDLQSGGPSVGYSWRPRQGMQLSTLQTLSWLFSSLVVQFFVCTGEWV